MPRNSPRREPSGRRNERRVIEAVIRAATDRAILLGHPEEDRSGPSMSRPCDALYTVGDEKWAVEHTTVDVYRDERLVRAPFVPLAASVERCLSAKVDCLVFVSLPSEPLLKELSWARLEAIMKPAILEALPRLAWDEEAVLNCLGVPLLLSKEQNYGIGQVVISRRYPVDIEAQRTALWRERIAGKRDSLSEYRGAGYRTVLILESEDLGNRVQAARRAFAEVAGSANGVIDDVWAAMTATRRWLLLSLKERGVVDVERKWIEA